MRIELNEEARIDAERVKAGLVQKPVKSGERYRVIWASKE